MQKKNILLKKIIFTIFIVFILRIGAHIPVANVDEKYLINIINLNPSLKIFFNTKNLILSVFTLGIIPNINSSIFIQILTSLFPYFQKLQKKEGQKGRKQIKQYTRFLTLIFALFQSLSIAVALKPFVFNYNFNICFEITLTLTTGAMIVLWLSDLITEFGIGNGSSIILALNIISILPNSLNLIIKSATPFLIISIIVRFLILIIGIIYLQEGVKIIPLITSKQLFVKKKYIFKKINSESFLPLKINQVGIMPLIFSSTFLGFFITFENFIKNKIPLIEFFISSQFFQIVYIFLNFITIVLFCFFYSNLVLNPKDLAKELNQMEVIIENIRPGQQTFLFLKKTLNRLTIIGSIFLGILGTLSNIGNTFGFGITSLIILVGVIIDITRQITKKSLEN
jgi:preprotein translocase subunit SecY